MNPSSFALKEWAIVIAALAGGEQLFLLRKGGLRDPKGRFSLKAREFFLYPTWEHLCEADVQPAFLKKFQTQTRPSKNPAEILFQVYAGVAYVGSLTDPKQWDQLQRYHIWNPVFFEKRMRYHPEIPLTLLVLRAYRLNRPVRHSVRPADAGCKSWVALDGSIPVQASEPVVDNRRFRAALEKISSIVEPIR